MIKKYKPYYLFVKNELEKDILNRIYSKNEKLPTNRELAKMYDVSKLTISKALQLMEKNGMIEAKHGAGVYVKSTTNQFTICYLISSANYSQSAEQNANILSVINKVQEGIQERISKENSNLFRLLNIHNYQDPSRNSIFDWIKIDKNNKGSLGIIFLEVAANNKFLNECVNNHIPYMIANGRDPALNNIMVNLEQGFYSATKYLITLGHKNIAFFGGLHENLSTRGVANALNDSNIKINYDYFHLIDELIKPDPEAFIQKYKNFQEKPTAVLCRSDYIAIKLMKSLKKENIKIPEDISIISYDNSYNAEIEDPPLTTMDNNLKECGYKTCDILIDLMLGKREKLLLQKNTVIPKLIIRDSCNKVD